MNGINIASVASWIQTAFVAGAAGCLWYSLKNVRKDTMFEVHRIEQQVEENEGNFLKTDKHTDICQIANLEMRTFIVAQNTELKDAIFKELRKFKLNEDSDA